MDVEDGAMEFQRIKEQQRDQSTGGREAARLNGDSGILEGLGSNTRRDPDYFETPATETQNQHNLQKDGNGNDDVVEYPAHNFDY